MFSHSCGPWGRSRLASPSDVELVSIPLVDVPDAILPASQISVHSKGPVAQSSSPPIAFATLLPDKTLCFCGFPLAVQCMDFFAKANNVREKIMIWDLYDNDFVQALDRMTMPSVKTSKMFRLPLVGDIDAGTIAQSIDLSRCVLWCGVTVIITASLFSNCRSGGTQNWCTHHQCRAAYFRDRGRRWSSQFGLPETMCVHTLSTLLLLLSESLVHSTGGISFLETHPCAPLQPPPSRSTHSNTLVLHFHGGGFVSMTAKAHEAYLRVWYAPLCPLSAWLFSPHCC